MLEPQQVLDRIQRVAEQDQEPQTADNDGLCNGSVDDTPALYPGQYPQKSLKPLHICRGEIRRIAQPCLRVLELPQPSSKLPFLMVVRDGATLTRRIVPLVTF